MGSVGSRFLIELGKVDARSKEKHKGENWRDMTFSYCFGKILSHLFKWWFAGKGNYKGTSGAHHLAKVSWYCDKIIWIEENRRRNDDRPGKTKMSLQFIINAARTVFDN